MPKRLYSYGKQRTDFYALAEELKTESEWVMGHMRGTHTMDSYGAIPKDHYPSLSYATYVVYSYHTPIAWIDARSGEWVQPGIKYSRTTTTHQGKITVALSVINKE